MLKKLSPLEELTEIAENTGPRETVGLPVEVIAKFLKHDDLLRIAINEAYRVYQNISDEFGDKLQLDEKQLIKELQSGFVNFYSEESVSPYVPLAGRGPWIVTSHGAVVYDAGGYGMLGFGHSRKDVKEVLSRNLVMANIMTPSFSQRRFVDILNSKIGYTRASTKPVYANYLCMNSGSEAMTVSMRLTDLHAKTATDPGGSHAGKEIVLLSLKGSFHGRTDRPARVSQSSRRYYQELASFRNLETVLSVEPNNISELKQAFERIKNDNLFLEAMFMEPIMGEGNPGLAITREFYDTARALTKEHDSLLVVDSVQAGLRAYGCLSIVDYPGFSDAEPPDMESFSKAVNAGQYPLSVLAVTERVSSFYKVGVYGNTMTANPRGLEVARAVLNQVTEELTQNIRERGAEFLDKLTTLKNELDGAITQVQGTGLLLSAELAAEFDVVGFDGVEHYMRTHGVNVIHGGKNSLRYTPYFHMTSEEIDLVINTTREAIKHFSR